MVKIVIIGSCRFEPYEVLKVPEKNEKWNTEEGYQEALKEFKPAIDEADIVIIHNPDGIGEHTMRDATYAVSKGKHVCVTFPIVTPANLNLLLKKGRL